jgi:hypothetical protein
MLDVIGRGKSLNNVAGQYRSLFESRLTRKTNVRAGGTFQINYINIA